jgi:hypothetical protein
MTRHRSVRRVARGRSRGQSVVFLALGGIALISTVGLALDGGRAAANYRQAQNAADSAALAVARQIFAAATQSTPSVPTQAQMLATSNTEIGHNRAIPGDANLSARLITNTLDNFVPDTGTGIRAHAALATITAQVNALLATVTATVTADEALATGLVRTIASGGSLANGQVDLINVNATVTALGIPLSAQGALLCLSSIQAHPTVGIWSLPSACALNSLGLVTTLLGTLGTISGSAGVNLSPQSTNAFIAPVVPYMPHTISSNALTTVNVLNLGTAVTASAANVVSQVGPSAGVLASNDFNLANVSTGLLGLAVSAPLVNIHAELDQAPGGTVTAPAPTCEPGSLTLGGTSHSILPNCHIVGLPLTLAGVTLKDFTSSITTSGCPGMTCSEHGCFLDLSVLGSIADVCIGEFDLSAAGSRMSSSPSTGNTALINGVTVTAHVDTPTYFLGILGWHMTQPTAKTSAAVLQVDDETDDAFNNAAYAVPDVATNMDCPCVTAPVRAGHSYYLYGSQMQSYSPVDKFASTWQGRVSAAAGHRIGATLSSVSGPGSGPGAYLSGGSYSLLPVINPATAVVEYYAAFKTVPGHAAWGQLVNTIPVQANPSTTWISDAAGLAAAMTVKVTQ